MDIICKVFCKSFDAYLIYRVREIPFLFLENALKKTTKYLLKFLFLFESTIPFRLIMENNFIQMTALAGPAVTYTIGPIYEISEMLNC